MEEFKNGKALDTDALENVSGGLVDAPVGAPVNNVANKAAHSASFNKTNNVNMQKGFQIFGRLANAFQIKLPKGPNGNGGNGGNGGR